ncbi:MAG: response regulator [Lachnospiraceae bacterium]|nr:response regulator [Lachnospiraceae bacterium]
MNLKKTLQRKIEYFNDENIPIEVKNFLLTHIYAVLATAIMGFVFLIAGLNPMIPTLAFCLTILLICAGYMVNLRQEYKLYTILYLLVFNFICYPLFYFLTGDIYNGAPLYFAMGVILTFFLTKGKTLLFMVITELAWYGYLLFYTYTYRADLAPYRSFLNAGEGIAACFVLASVMPVFIIYYQTIIFKKLHEKLLLANRSLNSAGRGKSRFLANLTHEIRTPMNAIIGMTEVILKEDLSNEAREQAETIKTASTELLSIINNILVYSKLNSNKMELLQTRYDFRKLIDDVIQSVVMEYGLNETDFQAYVDASIPHFLYGDDIRIKQVFRYLLFSSLHQLPYGRISLEINATRHDSEHTITLQCRIAETGRGLTETELNAVFGAYNEYDSRQRSDFKGMGLELFICRELLNLMDGSLKIESISGVGMALIFEFTNYILSEEVIATVEKPNEKCVLIYLEQKGGDNYWMQLMDNLKISPYYATSPNNFRLAMEERKYTHIFIPDDAYEALRPTIENAGCARYTYVVTDHQHVFEDFDDCRIIRRPVFCLNTVEVLNNTWDKEAYIKSVDKERVSYPGARVLVVDDNIVNLKVTLSVLADYGIKADMATSGDGCLNILSEEKYDLLLLDQLMPGMSGSETIHKLRKRGGLNSNIPAICITAEFGADVRERMIAEGFQDYIAKPIKEFYLDRILSTYLPKELLVTADAETEETAADEPAVADQEKDKDNTDLLQFDPDSGIEMVGGEKGVYLSILNTYYREGRRKLEQIDSLLAQDLSAYTTDVHALKSSSASVGAKNISERFKALEMAGKENNRSYIDTYHAETFLRFESLLDKIREYLIANDRFDDDGAGAGTPGGEEKPLELQTISDLKQALASVNLKYCEEKIGELSQINFGEKYNTQIRKIRSKYEQFDYHAVRALLEETENMINQEDKT